MKKNILMRAGIVLLIATLFSVGIFGSTWAKYSESVNFSDQTNIAAFGTIALKEDETETQYKQYVVSGQVVPGVDINAPYVVVNGKFDVNVALYVKVVAENLPRTVTCETTSDWALDTTQSDSNSKVYKYNGTLIPREQELKDVTIEFLKDNKILVSEHFSGGTNSSFKLTFSAWIEQID